MFLVENGLKQEGDLSPLVFTFAFKLCCILLGRWLVGLLVSYCRILLLNQCGLIILYKICNIC